MSEILRKWLSLRLGLVIDYNLQSFEELAYDGTLLANLLYNYGIIPRSKLDYIDKTEDPEIAYANLVYLKYWLRTIGINCTDQKLYSIARKNESAAIQLFYQVYVALNTKTKLNLLINKNTEKTLSNETSLSVKLQNVCTANPVIKKGETRAVIDWHRNRYTQLLQRCTAARNKFIGIPEEVSVKKPEVDNQLIEMTIKKLPYPHTPVENPNLQMKIVDGKCVCDTPGTKKYIQHIRQKYANIDKVQKQQRQMHKLFLSDMLGKLIETEDREFKEMITRELLKQSYYEKQLTSKLIDVRHQKNVILENLRQENEIVTKRKEYDYANNFFQQKTNLTLQEQRFIKNYHRQIELHRRLWAEKQRKRYKKHYAMCNEIVNDFVDLALKSHEYRCTFRGNVPPEVWQQWGALFSTAQPIFGVVDDVTEILLPDDAENDDALSIELYRQSGMDEADLQDYLTLSTIWDLEEPIDFYTQYFVEIDLANQILGYVIHRLLKLKYPCLPPRPVPELPPTNIRAALVGVNNNELITNLQNIFAKGRVNIIDLPTVINFCLNTYLNECVIDVDEKLNSESQKGGRGIGGKETGKGGAKAKDKKRKKSAIIEGGQEVKQTQTPKIFPEEELTFSKPGELGKAAYETINLGLEIDDYLLLDMLIEYLKQLKNSNGWILMNFPETITQAYAFEEIFTGRTVPKELKYFHGESDEELDYEEREPVFSLPEDPYKTVRLSKLLPNPQPSCHDKFVSFFTSVVRLVIKNLGSIESEISNFYENLSISSVLLYEKVDNEFLRDIVRLLSKDEVFAQMIYEDLLNGAIKILKEKGMKGKEGAEKEKKGGKKDKGKDKKGKKAKVEELEPESVAKEVVVWEEEIVEPSRPGEEYWEYIDLPLTVELSKLLASTWQKAEEVYIRDFKETFFTKRTHQNQIIPYIQQIEAHMQEYVERPDKKQDHVHEFQKIYNEIDQDLREDDEFKADLHNRLTEFRDKLWNICDTRMKESEEERIRIINENWFGNHTCTITNLYIKAFQLELDRCHASLQVLQDYYTAMAMKIPIEIYLPVYVLQDFNMLSTPTNGKKTSMYEKSIFAIANIFSDKTLTEKNNPFLKFIKTSIESTENYFSQWQTLTKSALKAVETQFTKKPGKIEKKPKKGQVSFNDKDFEIFERIEKMIDEWTVALDGEMLRARFRLKLLLERATEDINDNLNYGEQLFHDIFDRIKERYRDEINCVDEACQLFARAIEACEPIQSRLVIDGTQFFVDQKNLFYPDEPFEYDYVKERVSDNEFTIANLMKLFYIFRDLAPNGFMPERTFIYLLQDMVVQNKEDDYESPVPLYWRLLNYNDVSKFVRELYGESEYCNWRDFLIWNLGLPYPTEYELLDARQQFCSMDPDKTEYVNNQQFSCVHFWFEDEFSDDYDLHRVKLIKELLQMMFVSPILPNKFNYFLLLFYFCKDVEIVIGFSKALEMSLGNFVCWDMDIGIKFENVMWNQKCLEERHHREVLSTVTSALDVIVGNVLEQIDTFSDILGVYSEHESDEIDDCTLVTVSSNDEIVGEEHVAMGLPSLVYFLDFDVLINVVMTAFPWRMDFQTMDGKSLRERLEEIYNKTKRPEFKDQVFMHEFLNDSEFVDILNENAKFLEKIPSEVVRRLVEICTCEYKQQN